MLGRLTLFVLLLHVIFSTAVAPSSHWLARPRAAVLGLRGGGFGSSRGSGLGGDDSDDNSDAEDEGSDGAEPPNADASDCDSSGQGEEDPDRMSLGREDMARLFSPRAHQWGERAVSAAFVADAAALLSRTGHWRAAADGYKLSLLLAPSDWPPCARLLAALATALREAWEQRQQAPAEIHSPPEGNGGEGVFDDALLLLRAASARRPEDPTLLFQAGTTAYMCGRADVAADAYAAACDAALAGGDPHWPGLAPILNNVATLVMDEIHRTADSAAKFNLLQVAVRCLRASALLEPDAPCTIANLASALWTNLTVPLQDADDQAAAAAADQAPADQAGQDAPPPRMQLGPGHAPAGGGGGGAGAAQLPKIPYHTRRAEARADEVALVLRHATLVLPPDWAHLDTVWTRLAVVHLDTGKPNLAARALLDALAAASATLLGACTSGGGGSGSDKDSRGTRGSARSAAPQRVFRSSAGGDAPGPLAGPDGTNFPPSWWHHAVHLLGDALVAAKEHGSGPLDHAPSARSDKLFAGCAGGCAEHPSRVLALAASYLPRDPLLWAELGRAWLRLGLVDEGAAQLAAALDLGDATCGALRGGGAAWPGRASVLHGLGSAAGMNSDVEGAIGHFQAALAADPQGPNSAATRFLLARSLAERGDEGAALDQFEEAVGLGLWVSDALLKGSAFDDLRNHPRFLSIKERMAKNSPSR